MDSDVYKRGNDGSENKPMDPPPFSPSEDMRRQYLKRRRYELDGIGEKARNKDWRSVMKAMHNVRGSGAMYGFSGIGDAAAHLESVLREDDSPDAEPMLARYVEAVNQAYV